LWEKWPIFVTKSQFAKKKPHDTKITRRTKKNSTTTTANIAK